MTTLTSIVAIAENNVIADGATIPWQYPVDKRQYKARIANHPLIVGRKTYETLAKYEANLLQDTPITILTTDKTYTPSFEEHCCSHTKDEAIQWIENKSQKVYNVGGGEIYKLFWNETDRLIVSHIPETVSGTVSFPKISTTEWTVISIETFENFQVKTYQRQ